MEGIQAGLLSRWYKEGKLLSVFSSVLNKPNTTIRAIVLRKSLDGSRVILSE